MRLHEFGGLKRTTQILSHTISLWPVATGAADDIPRELPFEYQIPAQPRLPPSYEVSIGGGSYGNREANGFNAWVRYQITVRARGRDSAALTNITTNIAPLEHLLDRTYVPKITVALLQG